MKFKGRLIVSLRFFTALFILSAWLFAENDVEYKPLSISAVQEFSTIYNGQLDDGLIPFERIWVDHLGAFVNQSVVINQRFSANVGFGGTYQFPIPERGTGPNYPALRTKFLYIAPAGHLEYFWGNPENPWLKLRGGMFGYKYNSDAHNLGEYLFRSEVYPNILTSGGLMITNSAGAFLKGLLAEFQSGGLKLDVLATTEFSMPPLYSISLGAVGSYSLGGGILELGAGVNFKRLIPVMNNPSKTNKESGNAYVEVNGRQFAGNNGFYDEPRNYFRNQAFEDTAQAAYYTAQAAALDRDIELVQTINTVIQNWNMVKDTITDPASFYSVERAALDSAIAATPAGPALDSLVDLDYVYDNVRDYDGYYTASGTLLMFRAAFNAGKIIGQDWVGENGLKLFFEASLLGVKDYPVFYTDKLRRLPVMAGVHFPTFGFFDQLTFQAENWKSPYINSLSNKGLNHNIPGYPAGFDPYYSKNYYNDAADEDDWKWSFLVQKNFANISFAVQVARDHLRLVHDAFFLGPGYERGVMTPRKDSWYWSFQMGMGI